VHCECDSPHDLKGSAADSVTCQPRLAPVEPDLQACATGFTTPAMLIDVFPKARCGSFSDMPSRSSEVRSYPNIRHRSTHLRRPKSAIMRQRKRPCDVALPKRTETKRARYLRPAASKPGSERSRLKGPRLAIPASVPPELYGAMPIMMAPKVSGSDIHTVPAAQQVLTFGRVVFNLGNAAATVARRLFCAHKRRREHTYQPADNDGQRY
jgi:hypothetical protein